MQLQILVAQLNINNKLTNKNFDAHYLILSIRIFLFQYY